MLCLLTARINIYQTVWIPTLHTPLVFLYNNCIKRILIRKTRLYHRLDRQLQKTVQFTTEKPNEIGNILHVFKKTEGWFCSLRDCCNYFENCFNIILNGLIDFYMSF